MYNQGKIIKRLLGRPDSTDLTADSPNPTHVASTSETPYRHKVEQPIVYQTQEPVACLDRSHHGRIVVLGGRHVLKTLHLDDGLNVREGVDVRAAITAHHAASLASDQLSIKDVKVADSHGAEPTIFTACANGKIFMYDVSRLALRLPLDFVQTTDGSRQVNKLDINPHRATWMLAGGQDGIVRCFDIKAPATGRNGPTFRAFSSIRCNADAVRDLKWAPKDGMVFACATESGAVMKWDIRKPTAPLLKINAHDAQKGVTSIAWHFDGNHLISAGFDQKCHVWDLSKNAEKRQKPKWSIHAPSPINNVSWRPGLWSATAQGRRAAQVAVAYDDGGQLKKNGISCVHIWDLARPTMPYKEIEFEHSPYALLWHNQDLLWAVGPAGFRQANVAFAPKVMDRQPLSNLDFSARGQVLMFLEERAQVSRHPSTIRTREIIPPSSSYSSSPTGQMLSLSRSDSEEDVIGSFLGPKQRGSGGHRSQSRQSQPLSTTPPSAAGIDEQVISLEKAMKLTTPFRPQQVMAIGRIPAGASLPQTYRHFSQQYLEVLERGLPNSEKAETFDKRVTNILDEYAGVAGRASQFRLAQTWRILSYAMNLLLQSRSRYHLEQRLTNSGRKKSPPLKDPICDTRRIDSSSKLQVQGEETPRKAPSIASLDSHPPSTRSLLAGDIDNESNLATPLARPVEDSLPDLDDGEKRLTPVTEVGSFSLPPALYAARESPRRRLDSAPLSILSQGSQISSTEGYDFYDLEEALDTLPQAIDVPKKKEPLTLDSTEPTSPVRNRIKRPVRHDSDESIPPIFSLDTSHQASVLTNSSGGSLKSALRRPQQNRRPSPENSEREYGSRIRGKQIVESPEFRNRPLPTLERRGSSALTDDFLVSQTTTDTFESDSFDFAPAPVRPLTKLKVDPPTLQRTMSQHDQSPIRPQDNMSPSITETDFLYWDDDPDYPYPIFSNPHARERPPPINPYEMISKALAFETRRSPLHASAIVLLLQPLVPHSVIDPHQAAAILRQHHNRLMGMQLFVEAALLRNLCVRGWPAGIDIWGENYPSIFRPAQDRVAVGYACAQCHKTREISRSPGESSAIWKCERCRALVGPCAVCGHREGNMNSLPPMPMNGGLTAASRQADVTFLSTWWYCPGCSHGGHANCLQEWHAPASPSYESQLERSETIYDDIFPETNSDGCCPLDGCGHACLPGKWRNESSTARTEELGRAMREQYRGIVTGLKRPDYKPKAILDASVNSTPAGSVRGDSVEVPQSRAVESVRETLASNAVENRDVRPGGLMGILSSSPGRSGSAVGPNGMPVERERRKSVKFAGPTGEDRR
ncbi:hypothetical protein F5Y16DRAFT_346327 [Xylariaceae sp. FL0255]|nr:hypothetical protein F5Y16DRAFT_346327 [Xylariaceae sp. FL0255]